MPLPILRSGGLVLIGRELSPLAIAAGTIGVPGLEN